MFNPISRCDAPRRARASLAQWRPALAVAAALAVATHVAATDLSAVPLPTFTVGSTTDIKPNILMVLDDSGSMDWDFLPDWADNTPGNYSSLPSYLRRNASFNGVAYNPSVRYNPPIRFTSAGAKDTSTYPSQTGADADRGAGGGSKPNWTKVKNDGFGVQSTGESDLTNASYWTSVAGEYCDSPALTNCQAGTAPSGKFQYAAVLRWCSSSALTNCRALQDNTYSYPRAPAPRVATIKFSGNTNSKSVSGITVGGKQIMSGGSGNYNNADDLAVAVRDKINDCTSSINNSCQVVGYSAFRSGTTVSIMAPGATAETPSVSSNNVTVEASSFQRRKIPLGNVANSNNLSDAVAEGENYRTVITSSVTSYPYPGTDRKHANRTDCVTDTNADGTVDDRDSCSYTEEMTNYANWWTYYRTRMQMMKTATSRAFSTLDSDAAIAAGDSRYRVGYLSLNNNTGKDFLNIKLFGKDQKYEWYRKLFAARPQSGTPLRRALAQAGRLYAGRMNGTDFRGSTVEEPLEYSCQKNYTILSTDGFWNGDDGYKLDGSTAVGNADGALPRPYNDGAAAKLQTRTSRLQSRTDTQTADKHMLQKRVTGMQATELRLNVKIEQQQQRDGERKWWGIAWGDPRDVRTCTPDTTGDSRVDCPVRPVSQTPATGACTPGTDTSTGRITTCVYVPGAVTTGACTPIDPSTSSPFTVLNARTCSSGALVQDWADSATCTPGTASGLTTECRFNPTRSTNDQVTASCSPSDETDFSNPFIYKDCKVTNGTPVDADTCTATTSADANGKLISCSYKSPTAWADTSSCVPVSPSAGPTNYTVKEARECRQNGMTGGNSDTLADVAAYYYYTDLRSPTATGVDRTGSCTAADGTTDLCTDNVPAYDRDNNPKQHMTTHTLGLGVQGLMVYSPWQNDSNGTRKYYSDYWAQPSGDFHSVANAIQASPTNGICTWLTSGTACTWPTPAPDANANIDDLWHAAVNGHGTYFSAADPMSLADALTSVLGAIVNTPRPGTAAAAASSNPNITSSDNFVFSSSYRSVEWFGELIMQQFDTSGDLTPQKWSAMQLLDCATTSWQSAKPYKAGDAYQQGGVCYVVQEDYTAGATFDAGSSGTDGSKVKALTTPPLARRVLIAGAGATGLVPFEWTNLDDTQKAFFNYDYIKLVSSSRGLSQFCTSGGGCLTAGDQTVAAGEPLVSFLRGVRTNEGSWFRARRHVLGDIVSSEARYVKQPLLNYSDAGYATFKTSKANRAATVYVGANDGMLHAFNALTGQERWAFIPSGVLPDLYRLADANYANKHRYFVDGTPEVGDICPTAPATPCTDGTGWKTIIVGGLNQGGKSYYALDITDPENPKRMWEFTDAGLGFTYGNPRITKLKDGTWVVIVASGYNNADGIGRVYVLRASDGAIMNAGPISTGVGDSATPSGLAKLAARAPGSATNNTVEQVYGGDLLGNLWRFDVNGDIGASGRDAHLVINLKGADGVSQPITSKPTVASTDIDKPLILIGTGRYLGVTDLDDQKSYSFYGVQDQLDTTTLGSPRDAGTKFVTQVLTFTNADGSALTCPAGAPTCTSGQNVRTVTSEPVNYGDKNGWLIDFPAGGERSVTDATLALGTITFTTIKPQSSTTGTITGCTTDDQGVSAKSYLYYLDYLTGGAVAGTKNVGGEELCTCVATRPSVVKTEQGKLEGIIRMSGGGIPTGTDMGVTRREDLPFSSGGSSARRISWRELNGE